MSMSIESWHVEIPARTAMEGQGGPQRGQDETLMRKRSRRLSVPAGPMPRPIHIRQAVTAQGAARCCSAQPVRSMKAAANGIDLIASAKHAPGFFKEEEPGYWYLHILPYKIDL